MAHDVFISYSSADKPIADAVCASVEASGIRCWIAPRDVLPGLTYGKAIIRAINDSRILVLIFTSASNSSPQVMREIERAANRDLIIIPLRVENILPSEDIEYFISSSHWLDALTPPLEAHLNHLVETVSTLLKSSSRRNIPNIAGIPGPPAKDGEVEGLRSNVAQSDSRLTTILSDSALSIDEKASRCRKIYQETFQKDDELRYQKDLQGINAILGDPALSTEDKLDLYMKIYGEKADLRREIARREYEEFIAIAEAKVDKEARPHLRESLESEGQAMFKEVRAARAKESQRKWDDSHREKEGIFGENPLSDLLRGRRS